MMNMVKKISYLLAGIAVFLLILAVGLGIAAGFDCMSAIGCLAGAFAAAISGAVLSVIWKFYEKK